MVSKKSRAVVRENKHRRLRNRFSGTAARPRLAVFRSNNHMYSQIIDDTAVSYTHLSSTDIRVQTDQQQHLVEYSREKECLDIWVLRESQSRILK